MIRLLSPWNFFNIDIWNTRWTSIKPGVKANLLATYPTHLRISKGLINCGLNLSLFSNLITPFICETLSRCYSLIGSSISLNFSICIFLPPTLMNCQDLILNHINLFQGLFQKIIPHGLTLNASTNQWKIYTFSNTLPQTEPYQSYNGNYYYMWSQLMARIAPNNHQSRSHMHEACPSTLE